MENGTSGRVRILGSLASENGVGVVRFEERLDADIDDVWSALTESKRLASWYGDVEGDLRVGGTYRALLHASGWEGTGHVEECEPPRRFVVVSKGLDDESEVSTEVTLSADGSQTALVVEKRGLPLDLLWAFGAGNQIHVEDLAAHLAGGGRVDAKTRFDELAPAYTELAAAIR